MDEKHDAVVRLGLSTSLSQTVAPLRTESRDRCPSVFLIGHSQRASDGTREDFGDRCFCLRFLSIIWAVSEE